MAPLADDCYTGNPIGRLVTFSVQNQVLISSGCIGASDLESPGLPFHLKLKLPVKPLRIRTAYLAAGSFQCAASAVTRKLAPDFAIVQRHREGSALVKRMRCHAHVEAIGLCHA